MESTGRVDRINVSRGGVPKKPGHRHVDGRFRRIDQERHPGDSRLYARVLVPGTLRAGEAVRVEGAGGRDWPA